MKPAVTQPKKMMEMFSNAVNHVQHSFQQVSGGEEGGTTTTSTL